MVSQFVVEAGLGRRVWLFDSLAAQRRTQAPTPASRTRGWPSPTTISMELVTGGALRPTPSVKIFVAGEVVTRGTWFARFGPFRIS
jgi:hypothetical protein